MKRWQRLALIISLATTILIAAFGVIIGYYYEDRVKTIVVEQLNQILDTEVQVKDIRLSLLKKFPKASIQFDDIRIQEKSNRKNKGDIISAKALFLEFNPFDLLTGNYTIDAIQLEDGVINILRFEDGTDNYHFFSDGEENAAFKLLLQKVTVQSSELNYQDLQKRISFNTFLDDLVFSGDFNQTEFDMTLDAKGRVNNFNSDGLTLTRPREISVNIILDVLKNEGIYALKAAEVWFGNLNLDVKGQIKELDKGVEYDLVTKSKNANLSELQEFLTPNLVEKFEKYSAKGVLDISGKIKGIMSNSSNPSIDFEFDLHDGSLSHREFSVNANNITLHGSYSNGLEQSAKTSTIVLDTFSFDGNFGLNHGRLSIENFDHPLLTLNANLNIDLEQVRKLLNRDSILQLNGKLLANIHGSARFEELSKFTARDMKSASIAGNLRIEQAGFQNMGMPYAFEKISGQLGFGKNLLNVDSLTFEVAGVQLRLDGKLHNLIPYLFYPDEKMLVSANLSCPDMNIDKLIPEKSESQNERGATLPVSKLIELELNIDAKQFSYRKFMAHNFKCQLKSKYPNLILQEIEFEGMDGEVNGWVELEFVGPERTTINSNLNLKHVDISALFYQCENFGQNAINSEHIKGLSDVELEFRSVFDRDFNLISDETYARGQVEIRNGELIEYAQAMALSKYVDVNELEHIKFSKLSNVIEIKNRMVYIPQMEVKSSALEIVLSGKHSFDNQFEYHFQLWLNDFLFKKAKRTKKNKDEFGEIEADESGRAKLFVRMTGTPDDYEISLDRKAVREKWNDNITEERSELKQIFKEEFGKEKTPKKIAPGNFNIEWEEGSETSTETIDTQESETQKRLNEAGQKKEKKGLFGKENKDEYEEYDPKKFD